MSLPGCVSLVFVTCGCRNSLTGPTSQRGVSDPFHCHQSVALGNMWPVIACRNPVLPVVKGNDRHSRLTLLTYFKQPHRHVGPHHPIKKSNRTCNTIHRRFLEGKE